LSAAETLNIVVPMAGRGSRFANAGYTTPKPLLPLGSQPMVEWVIDNIRPRRPHRFIFLCLADHLRHYPEVPEALKDICPDCAIVPVETVTEGAACTVLLARQLIDSDAPLMIANSDQYVSLDINDYLDVADRAAADGLIMTFWADHPKWSYCRLGPGGRVTEVVEKQVVSNDATVGIYNFRKGRDFVRAADRMIASDLRVNGEFYVAPVYNELIKEGHSIVVAATGRERDGMYGLGTPEDFEFFKTTDLFRQQVMPPRS
jgi:NDP-sugar pyrophosphorylase family protein